MGMAEHEILLVDDNPSDRANPADACPGLPAGGAGRDIPFMRTSGVIGGHVAVAYMRAGAPNLVRQDLRIGLTSTISNQLLGGVLRGEPLRLSEGLRCAEEALLRSERLRAICCGRSSACRRESRGSGASSSRRS